MVRRRMEIWIPVASFEDYVYDLDDSRMAFGNQVDKLLACSYLEAAVIASGILFGCQIASVLIVNLLV